MSHHFEFDPDDETAIDTLVDIHQSTAGRAIGVAQDMIDELETIRKTPENIIPTLAPTAQVYRDMGLMYPYTGALIRATRDTTHLIDQIDALRSSARMKLQNAAKKHIKDKYNIDNPSDLYIPWNVLAHVGDEVLNKAHEVKQELDKTKPWTQNIPADTFLMPQTRGKVPSMTMGPGAFAASTRPRKRTWN